MLANKDKRYSSKLHRKGWKQIVAMTVLLKAAQKQCIVLEPFP